MFKIRNSGADLISDIEHKYSTWYQIFNDTYLPLIMQCKKWHFSHENLIMGDVVYFKLTESKMGQNWRVGKVEGVKTGSDGYVRQVIITYKDTSGDSRQD